jgi:hypothetical protein
MDLNLLTFILLSVVQLLVVGVAFGKLSSDNSWIKKTIEVNAKDIKYLMKGENK